MPGNGDKSTLGEFLMRLAKEPGLAKKFRDDPDKAVKDAKVSDDAVKVLKTRDAEKIRAAVVHDLGADAKIALIVFPINLP